MVKRSKTAGALSLLLTVAAFVPALADSEPLEKVVNGMLVIPRIGAAGVGLILGTPVAVVRETASSYMNMTGQAADKVGGKDCAPSCVLATIVTAPASLVVGTGKGLFYGGKNGLVDGFNSPLSPASLSLSKDLEGK